MDNKENNSKNGITILTLVVSILAIALSGAALVFTIFNNTGKKAEPEAPAVDLTRESEDIQYVLYLGTNDKDTDEPVFSKEDGKEEAKKILIDNFGGYTIQEAEGGWKDEDIIYQEYTLVIYLSDTDMDKVHAAADQQLCPYNGVNSKTKERINSDPV